MIGMIVLRALMVASLAVEKTPSCLIYGGSQQAGLITFNPRSNSPFSIGPCSNTFMFSAGGKGLLKQGEHVVSGNRGPDNRSLRACGQPCP